ncbi:MAG: DUF975 family protein [Treponema sp.]|nr:DUF975 family protein [Treponema sp.]MCL2237529.1 DUF975 family protein [Treponema sp.]
MSNENNSTEQNPYEAPQHSSTGLVLIDNPGLRALSRQQLKGVRGKMALATLIYFLIIYPVSFIFTDYTVLGIVNPLYNPALSNLASLFVLLISGAFMLGFAGFYLKRVRDEEIFIKNIFDGFKRFFPSLLLMLLYTLFIILWSLLLIVPGIIKSFSYSMAFYIMNDNPGIKPIEALKKSQLMMNGHKGKLFLLYLGFFWWFVLGTITLGIGFLWIYPYIQLSVANFYQNLKKEQE